jgi:hypothetical protein
MGYEANELERVLRDGPLGLPNRIPLYPLVEWGWDRDECEWFLWDHFKVWWPKSACVACPFAFALDDPPPSEVPDAPYRTHASS